MTQCQRHPCLLRYYQNHDMKRICIYAKDITYIIGCSKAHAYRLLVNIRAANKKNKQHYVTVKEFCAYTGIDESMIDLGRV